jgi:enoyl-CoA hydratase/carnithine racemase
MTNTFVRFTVERHVGWMEFTRSPVNAFTRETAAELADTPDFAEGVDAFLAKRPPVWRRD